MQTAEKYSIFSESSSTAALFVRPSSMTWLHGEPRLAQRSHFPPDSNFLQSTLDFLHCWQELWPTVRCFFGAGPASEDCSLFEGMILSTTSKNEWVASFWTV